MGEGKQSSASMTIEIKNKPKCYIESDVFLKVVALFLEYTDDTSYSF